MRKLLKQKRLEKKYTQEKVADLVSISRQYYGKIELGRRNPTFALSRRIKKTLEFQADEIFDDFD